MPTRPPARALVPLLSLVTVVVVSLVSVWKSPPFPLSDSALFEYYGWNMLHGQHLYADLLDVRLPSVFYVNELWQSLYGENYSLHTWAEAFVNLISIGFFALLMRTYRVALWALGTVLFAVFFCLAFPEFNYPQHYAVPLILLGFLMGARRWDVAAGAAIALATTFWLPALLMLVPLVYADRSRARVLGLGLGTVGTFLAYYLAFVPALGPRWPAYPISLWPTEALRTGIDVSQLQETILNSELGPAIGTLLLTLFAVIRKPETNAQRFAICWAVCALIATAIPPRFAEHFFLPAVPALAMAIATFSWNVKILSKRFALLLLAAALLFVTFVKAYQFTLDGQHYARYVRAMGEGIRSYSGPDTVVWTDEYVPELYLAMKARQPDRYGSIHGVGSGYVLIHTTFVRLAAERWNLSPSVVVFGPRRPLPRDLSIVMMAPQSAGPQVYDIACPDLTFGAFIVYAIPRLAGVIRCGLGGLNR